MANIDDLIQRARTIRIETKSKKNTADRIGGLLLDIVNGLVEAQSLKAAQYGGIVATSADVVSDYAAKGYSGPYFYLVGSSLNSLVVYQYAGTGSPVQAFGGAAYDFVDYSEALSRIDDLDSQIDQNENIIDELAQYDKTTKQSRNLLNLNDSDYTPNVLIRSNGNYQASETLDSTGFIACVAGEQIIASSEGVQTAIVRSYCFYDSSKQALGITQLDGYVSSFIVPENAVFFRVSFIHSYEKVQLEKGNAATEYMEYGTTETTISNVKLNEHIVVDGNLSQNIKTNIAKIPTLTKKYEGVNILDPSTIDNGTGDKGTYLDKTTGKKRASSSNTTCVSDYIPLTDEGLRVIGISATGVNGWARYGSKSEDSYISGGNSVTITKVEGANFVRVCLLKNTNQMVSVGTDAKEYTPYVEPTIGLNADSFVDKSINVSKIKDSYRLLLDNVLAGREIVILGDSSMTSDKWPQLLAAIKDVVGFSVYNGAEGGMSWSSPNGSPYEHWNTIKSSIVGDSPIICIGCGGVNISAYTQGYDVVLARCYDDTSAMANGLDKAIQTIKTIKMEYPKAQIFLQNNWLTLTGYTLENALKRLKLKEFYEALCDYFGCVLVDVNRGCNIATYTENYEVDGSYPKRWATSDGTHINQTEGEKRVFAIWLGHLIKYLFIPN